MRAGLVAAVAVVVVAVVGACSWTIKKENKKKSITVCFDIEQKMSYHSLIEEKNHFR